MFVRSISGCFFAVVEIVAFGVMIFFVYFWKKLLTRNKVGVIMDL